MKYAEAVLVPETQGNSIHCRLDRDPRFEELLHYHDEIEIVLIDDSKGEAFIGDRFVDFSCGQVFVIGSGVPHRFIFKESSDSKAFVLQFHPSYFGGHFIENKEMADLKHLLKRSVHGLKFSNNVDKPQLEAYFRSMIDEKGMPKVLALLGLLNQLSSSEDVEQISSYGYEKISNSTAKDRLNKVYDYMLENYDKDEISLEKVAAVANMSVYSFCRYIKKTTNKTYGTIINELRIGKACKLLAETDLNIAEVCYQSGFNNLSNFSRIFKKLTHKTPKEYVNHLKLKKSSPF
ncbi:AraC family transcriptional regulator [Jiulongibacter sp. NS-SX5]|uniref:AraC family transcriptional regulator n=1 Tax=Jiulongibacter sp. NS-SX5 TaxID=3463854 RepID=UPI00405A286E